MRNGKGKPNPRRAELKALSAELKPFVKAGIYATTNEALVAHYTKQTGAKDWRTFNGWKDAGYLVLKGQHGFPIWATPRQRGEGKPATTPEPAPANLTGDDDAREWFPVCYLFHDQQVRPAAEGAHTLPLDLVAA